MVDYIYETQYLIRVLLGTLIVKRAAERKHPHCTITGNQCYQGSMKFKKSAGNLGL